MRWTPIRAFDQQLVQQLAGGRGTGLAAALEQQLGKAAGVDMGADAGRATGGQVREMESLIQPMPQQAWSSANPRVRSALEGALAKLAEPKVRWTIRQWREMAFRYRPPHRQNSAAPCCHTPRRQHRNLAWRHNWWLLMPALESRLGQSPFAGLLQSSWDAWARNEIE